MWSVVGVLYQPIFISISSHFLSFRYYLEDETNFQTLDNKDIIKLVYNAHAVCLSSALAWREEEERRRSRAARFADRTPSAAHPSHHRWPDRAMVPAPYNNGARRAELFAPLWWWTQAGIMSAGSWMEPVACPSYSASSRQIRGKQTKMLRAQLAVKWCVMAARRPPVRPTVRPGGTEGERGREGDTGTERRTPPASLALSAAPGPAWRTAGPVHRPVPWEHYGQFVTGMSWMGALENS